MPTEVRTIIALWRLLDDIDTLDDACKSDDAVFRKRAYEIQRKRFDILSDEEFDRLASTPTPASGVDAVKVKPLKWRTQEGRWLVFHADDYTVRAGCWYFKQDYMGQTANEDTAKAACQKHHDKRIRSALSPAATPASEAGGAALALDSEMRNAEFETWARKNGCHLHLHEGGEDRRYGYDLTERAWLGWCAALAKPASSPAGGDVVEAATAFDKLVSYGVRRSDRHGTGTLFLLAGGHSFYLADIDRDAIRWALSHAGRVE